MEMDNEKTVVVLDIGSEYTKCGFAGEAGPRFILATQIILPTGHKLKWRDVKTTPDQRVFLIKFLHNIYYRHLLINPKERRVVVVENILCSSNVRNLLADILFTHYESLSILFAPSHLVSLFTLGISSAIVLDCGYKETCVLPVFEGYTLLNSWQSAPLGSELIHNNIMLEIVGKGKVVGELDNESQLSSCDHASVSDHATEDFKVRACFVSPFSRAESWKLWKDGSNPKPHLHQKDFIFPLDSSGNGRLLQIPSEVRESVVECLFTGDNDQITLASLLLRAILASPLDVRRVLAENIVLIGGTAMIPGFSNRLVEELSMALELPEFSELLALKHSFKVHQPPGMANYVAWLGAAIFGALECLPGRSLTRTNYLEKCIVSDWCTNIDDGIHSLQRVEITRQ